MPETTETQSPAPVTETPATAADETPKVDVAALVAKYKRSNGAKAPTSLNAATPGTVKPNESKVADPVKSAPAAEIATPETPVETKPAVEEKPPVDELNELAKATKARRLAAEESRRAKEAADRKSVDLDRERDGLKEIQELRDLAKTNPVAALEKMGATPKQVADWIVKQGSPTNQVAALEEKIAKLEQAAEAREQKATEAQTKAQEAAAAADLSARVSQFVTEVRNDQKYEAINTLLTADELTREANMCRSWLVQNREMLIRTGRGDPLTYENSQVASMIEARYASRLATIKQRYASATTTPQATKDVQEPGQEKQPPRTLTSNLQSETVPKQDKPWKGKDRKTQNKIIAEMLKKSSRSA